MSAPERTVVFTHQADQDFEDILLFSLRSWGEERAWEYKATLDKVVRSIVDYPELGVAREEVAKELRSISAGQHVIFYRTRPPLVIVDRILHQRQSTSGQFDISSDE